MSRRPVGQRDLPIIECLDPPRHTGRKRVDLRQALNGMIYQLRSGCLWNYLPKDFGDDSSVHRTFQRWIERGVLTEIWLVLVAHCEGLGDVDYTWRSADGFMGKARFGGTRSAQTPRIEPKKCTKRSFLVDGKGGVLSVSVAGANVHDAKLLAATISDLIVGHPDPEAGPQHLCLDKGYDNPNGRTAAREAGYVEHIRRIGEEKLDTKNCKTYPARRWVVERDGAWLNKCRGILVRYNKKSANYLGLIQLAVSLLWYCRAIKLAPLALPEAF